MDNGMGTRVEHRHPEAEPEPDAGGPPGVRVERSGARKGGGRAAGRVATGSGVAAVALWAMARRIRRKRRERHEPEPAPEPMTVVQLIPERWVAALGDGRWKGPAAGLGAAWLLLRWAELRRLKRLTRIMTKSR